MRGRRARGRFNEGVILFVLFFGPVFAALVAYLGPWEVIPDRSTAYGVLINPARPLPQQPSVAQQPGVAGGGSWLTGRWSLIYRSEAACAQSCREWLYTLGQIHKALAEDQGRVQPVFLHAAGIPAAAVSSFLNVSVEGDAAGRLAAELTAAHPGPIYISDPLGNLVLAYPADARDKGILKDLERLLRLSRIG
jgi:hypothetical protein